MLLLFGIKFLYRDGLLNLMISLFIRSADAQEFTEAEQCQHRNLFSTTFDSCNLIDSFFFVDAASNRSSIHLDPALGASTWFHVSAQADPFIATAVIPVFSWRFIDIIQQSASSVGCSLFLPGDPPKNGSRFASFQRCPSHQSRIAGLHLRHDAHHALFHDSRGYCCLRFSISVIFHASHSYNSTRRIMLSDNSAFIGSGAFLPVKISQSFMKAVHAALTLLLDSSPESLFICIACLKWTTIWVRSWAELSPVR